VSDVALVDGDPVDEPDRSADRLIGLSCFETISFHEGRLVHGEDHLERLSRSARTIGLGPNGGWEAVDEHIETALARTEYSAGIVRVSLHATGAPVGLHLADRSAEVQVLVTAPRYGDVHDGVTAVTSTIEAPTGGWPAHVKAACLPRTMAHREARGRGAFEGLMLDDADRVVCGTRSNVFVVGDEIVTPPSPPAFPGVTRQRVVDAIDETPVRVRPVARSALDEAREVFLTFTGPGVVPVVELDGNPVGEGEPGPWARRLADEIEPTGSAGEKGRSRND